MHNDQQTQTRGYQVEQQATRYERNPDFIFRRIVNEVVLVPVRQNVADMDCIYTLNPLGAFIWERLETPATVDDLQAVVMAEYDVGPDVAAADVVGFFGELEAADAVRRV